MAAGEGSHLERYARVLKTVSRLRGLDEARAMPFSLIENGASLVRPGDSDRETVRGCVEINSSFQSKVPVVVGAEDSAKHRFL